MIPTPPPPAAIIGVLKKDVFSFSVWKQIEKRVEMWDVIHGGSFNRPGMCKKHLKSLRTCRIYSLNHGKSLSVSKSIK